MTAPTTWEEALAAVDAVLATPIEDGFPLPGDLFQNLGPIPPELQPRIDASLVGIVARIKASEDAANRVLQELADTRTMQSAWSQKSDAPVYVDLTM